MMGSAGERRGVRSSVSKSTVDLPTGAAAPASFQAMVDSIDQMIWSTRPDGYHDYYNARWYEFTGVPYGSTDGAAWNGMFHPDDQETAWQVWRHSLATGEPYHIEYRLRHRSGQYRWVLGRARPVRDDAGAIVRWYGTCTDIHDLKTAEEELRRTSALLQLIGDSTPDMVYAKDRESRVLYANTAVQRVVDRPLAEILGHTDLDWAADLEEARSILDNDRHVVETGEILDRDEVFTGTDGETRCFRSVKAPLRDIDGEIIGLVGLTSDMTERRRAEERERLLAREVDHRARNLLSIVQSVIQLTRSEDAGELKAALTGRVHALARAHTLLADSRWDGADLQDLLAEELAPFAAEDAQRVRLSGPHVGLKPDAAQTLALIFHELTTNSAKYGALSRGEGRLAVEWAVTGAGPDLRFELRWTEREGPSVGVPTRRGFGSTVLKTSVERQLRGQVRQLWEPAGLVCEISAPMAEIGAL
jgi:PAS domain S-box-containing protein